MDRDQRHILMMLIVGLCALVAVAALRSCDSRAAAAEPIASSPQLPDAVNYLGLCSWDCEDDVRRVAVCWTERDAFLCSVGDVDLVNLESGIWRANAVLRPAPIGTSSGTMRDCLSYGGPDEPYAPWNPTNDCCQQYDLDRDGDVDLADFVLWQR